MISKHHDNPNYRNSSLLNNNEAIFGIDLFDLINLFLRRKKWIISIIGGVILPTLIIVLLTPNKYMSTASILPSGNTDNLAALKDLAGFGGSMVKDENSSELYPIILRSRLILNAVLQKKYSFNHDSDKKTITLSEYFNITNPDLLRSALTNITFINVDKKKGVIYLSVETKYPELSQAVVKVYLTELEIFNVHKRKSQAKENAKYLAHQLSESENELSLAEQIIEEFQKANRDWYKSTHPEIVVTLARLQREIEIRSRKYVLLSQEYEIAMLNAQKDVPIVRILDAPSIPLVKSGPKRLLTIMIAGIVSLLGAIFVILLTEVIKKKSLGPEKESYDAFRKELREIPIINRILDKTTKENQETIDNPA